MHHFQYLNPTEGKIFDKPKFPCSAKYSNIQAVKQTVLTHLSNTTLFSHLIPISIVNQKIWLILVTYLSQLLISLLDAHQKPFSFLGCRTRQINQSEFHKQTIKKPACHEHIRNLTSYSMTYETKIIDKT